ncbi:AAA family ATPase [Mucilaginibacter sp. KACC 22063]|uniref:AAA family ATPase n=1 Tax=Mucilaginibacter sp. KACC 22063 TaxID=3025666 RepID=UPI002366C7A8|nr:AAA family ATPase [Mucilaginibacter sp. KACC 22063]WDF56172.1 AAA family ATPase [Mucilaginibacter sp. KACC 22063]
MKIIDVKIRNFRKLINIEFTCKESINTIVGPNGVGKSSIIDAVRLTKSILLQSQDNEAQAALQNMGIFSPQNNSVLFNTICNDESKEITIKLSIKLSKEELDLVSDKIHDFAILRLQNQLGQIPGNRLNLIAYLSTPAGKQQHLQIIEDTKALLDKFSLEKDLAHIELTASNTQISGKNGFDQELVSFVLRSISLNQTLFSVFPADRNFPTGEVNIQLGQGDLLQQIQSYSIQPNLKFHRLKNTIINYLLMNNNDISSIQNDFKLIFENLIPGKELFGIRIEDATNRLSVLIRETSTQAIYDIDFLSSGEKGLLLTLFLLIRTVAKGGIVIIDEPELHLNPAVCKNIISFLYNNIVSKQDVQIIMTTHSAEILTATKEDDRFQLLHLIGSNIISPIFKNDNNEASEAIKALGISTADLLFNKGVIYLEGTTDEEYINEILKSYTVNFKIQSLGGRSIIETEIKTLQESDRKGKLKGLHIFILDFDNKPTELKDTENVKIIQWDRYSFENYLLNTDVMYGIVRDRNPKHFPSSRTEFTREVKNLAFKQIDAVAIADVSKSFIPQTIGLSKKDLGTSTSPIEVAELLTEKILNLKSTLDAFIPESWSNTFIDAVNAKTIQLKEEWEENWKKYCKGKELLVSIYQTFGLSNYKDFIKALIAQNKDNKTEEWQVIKNKIEYIIQK